MFGLASKRVVTTEGLCHAVVLVDGERIVDVVRRDEVGHGFPIEDFGNLAISPGVIDTHVHINEPGRSEWEGFETATQAAAAGGVTTIADMPLNSSPVTTTVAALRAKQAAAAGKCWVDVGFYGGLIHNSAQNIPALLAAGVLGIKAFLCDSGLPEFSAVTEDDLRAALPAIARANRPLLVHAELSSPNGSPRDTRSYAQYVDSRPPQWEHDAIELLLRLADEFGCHIHIVHLAAATALPMLAAAKEKHQQTRVTVETCPHYLLFCAEDIPDADPRFKCAPPIRQRAHQVALWEGLRNGTIDTIGSDHSPCPPDMKCIDSGDLAAAWGGIAGLQFLLPAVNTAAGNTTSLVELAKWLSRAPAELIGVAGHKGRLAAGMDADIVIWSPDQQFTVGTEQPIYHRHKTTPYEGRHLRGVVQRTYVRGRLVYAEKIFSDRPSGMLLKRPQ
jgi:allantoinase